MGGHFCRRNTSIIFWCTILFCFLTASCSCLSDTETREMEGGAGAGRGGRGGGAGSTIPCVACFSCLVEMKPYHWPGPHALVRKPEGIVYNLGEGDKLVIVVEMYEGPGTVLRIQTSFISDVLVRVFFFFFAVRIKTVVRTNDFEIIVGENFG